MQQPIDIGAGAPRTVQAHPPYATWLRERLGNTVAATVEKYLRQREPGMIPLAVGAPAPELFPVELIGRAFAAACAHDSVAALQYGPAEGAQPLREVIAERLLRRGINATPSEILVTSGSTQGLDLLGRAFLEPGDTVVTEAPTFLGVFACWAGHRPRYLSVALDAEGLCLDSLEDLLRREPAPPKFLYVIPTFQNPAGVSLSLDRRARLLELAHRYDLLIVEDDAYGELSFAPEGAPPALRSLPGAGERVIYLGSFSKTLAPGLRLGYLVAPEWMVKQLGSVKTAADLHTDGVTQHAVAQLCRHDGPDFDRHIGQLRAAYRIRRDAMLNALASFLPETCRWQPPAGGSSCGWSSQGRCGAWKSYRWQPPTG